MSQPVIPDTIRCIVAGCRDFTDYYFVKEKLDNIFLNYKGEQIIIVSGRCSVGKATWINNEGIEVCGVDGLGERYAKENNFELVTFEADWNLGRSAGPIRNKKMANCATHCVIFWDGKSKGTKSMKEIAKACNLVLRVIRVN